MDKDAEFALYSYAGENWNLSEAVWERAEGVEGSFTVRLDALEEPDVHVRRTTVPGQRRKVVTEKLVTHSPDITSHLEDGGIVIDGYCGVDALELEGTDVVLPRVVRILLRKVFLHYQEHGELPEGVSFIQ